MSFACQLRIVLDTEDKEEAERRLDIINRGIDNILYQYALTGVETVESEVYDF